MNSLPAIAFKTAAEPSTSSDPLAIYVGRIARGDQTALASLYDGTIRLTYGLALRIVRNQSDAEEVIVDAYMQVWRSAGTFDPERGSIRNWLCMIARTRALDRARSLGAAAFMQPFERDYIEQADNPERLASLSQLQQKVGRALSALPGDVRRTGELAFLDGISHSEVAQSLN